MFKDDDMTENYGCTLSKDELMEQDANNKEDSILF